MANDTSKSPTAKRAEQRKLDNSSEPTQTVIVTTTPSAELKVLDKILKFETDFPVEYPFGL